VGNDLDAAIGRALRRARKALGWTLRDAAERSEDHFRPSSIAGYERGERGLRIDRLVMLAEVYGVAPDRLLAEALREARGQSPILIDLSHLEDLPSNERALVTAFVREVAELRDHETRDVITLRSEDLEILASASRIRPEELASRLASGRSAT
jgi:transcriptional regulator with XRE-family HTH domain